MHIIACDMPRPSRPPVGVGELIDAAPLFPDLIVFPDVDDATLAREEPSARTARAVLLGGGTWSAYLTKLLPPRRPGDGVTA